MFEVRDGKEVLVVFEEEEVDLVILDIMLLEFDGWFVCWRIWKMFEVFIIMLMVCVDEDDMLFGFEFGVDDYVMKLYSLLILLVRVKRLLESRKVIK